MQERHVPFRATAFVGAAAVLWGATFPIGKAALASVDVPTLMVTTRALGAVTVVIVLAVTRRVPHILALRAMAPSSLALGTTLFIGFWLQTEGLARTTATSAGFVVSLYVVLTPIVAWCSIGAGVDRRDRVSVVIAFAGLFLIASTEPGVPTVSTGTGLLVLAALTWAGHIVLLARIAGRHDPVAIALGQLIVATALHLVVGVPVGVDADAIANAVPHVVVLGVLGSGIAYTVQALGQRDLTPQRAAVVISLEAVVSAVIGVAWLDETMRWHQWLGAAAIVSAIAVGSTARSRSASPQG